MLAGKDTDVVGQGQAGSKTNDESDPLFWVSKRQAICISGDDGGVSSPGVRLVWSR